MFNAIRQLGGAFGIALLTTAIVIVGPLHAVAAHVVPDLTAYRVAFLVAALVALSGVPVALTINDAEAANTMPARKPRARGRPALGASDPEPEAQSQLVGVILKRGR